ncbi:phage antirepressor KilAC domain-containing protein [uncultured Microbacterium sp.]|uniref:phage antirepressor KilAC domain-containing protein n=1 Tax=uncultured Microbacterium sp. TaxID=191216 RepID=UPI0025DB91D5|nr:phage antirepressor KilAC domain-containing protein [uncultured Microbacterium sp.]
MSVLQQPRHLIARMPGHGDVHLTIDGAYTYIQLADLERIVLGETDGDPDRGLATLDAALDWARAQHTTTGNALAEWLPTFLATVDDEVLEQAHRMPSFIDAVPVRKAAAMLDADPAISIGQTTLFEHMASIGWIKRTGADAAWQLTATARRFDWLTTRTVIVRRKHYRQVYVTARGLEALHISLRGMGAPPAEPAPQPTLFD